MPKRARRKSRSGFYHVVPKGLSDQLLFLGDADRRLYLSLLDEAIGPHDVTAHAWCLMSNHVHLVLEDPSDHLGEAMKFAHERYATYFARRTGRSGGIFRKPFWSEPIESDEYLLCAVRYVHNNPAAAGICEPFSYEWSSARDYLGRGGGLTKTSTVLEMTGGERGFVEFSSEGNSTALPFPGSRLSGHLGEEELVRVAQDILGTRDVELSKRDLSARRASVIALDGHGFTTAQISRVTGLTRQACRTLLLSQ